MNETAKNYAFPQSPEDYGPKKPIIAKLAKEMQTAAEPMPEKLVLEDVLSPDTPWVGGCSYLLCLTSLFMHTERGRTDFYTDESTRADFNGNYGFGDEDTPLPLHNRERVYKVFLTATGMGFVNHWDRDGQHQNYEMTDDYINRSMRFCGYTYETVPADAEENVLQRIRYSLCAGIPVMARYTDGWELIVGYDGDTLILRKGEGTVEKTDYRDGLDFFLFITSTDVTPVDWKDLVAEVIGVMETDKPHVGMQGYREVIETLENDDLFVPMTMEEQQTFANALIWKYFVGHSEARGFSGQGFEWRFLNRYEDANRLGDLMNQLSYYGDQHHQIGWCGYNIFTAAGNDIRPRQVRERMIEAVYHMMDNDRIMCRIMKQLVGLETPDVLLAKDPDTGEIFDTQIRVREDASYEEIMAGIRIRQTQEINLAEDLEAIGGVEPVMEDGRLVFTGSNGIDDIDGMQLKMPVTVPFLVRMRMKTTRNNVHIYFGDGCITFRKHPHTYDSLYIRDNAIGLYYGYDQKGEVEPDTFFDLEWLVGKDRFTVAVDGEVRHYGENYPYMHMPSLWKDFLRFGTADGNTLTVEHIMVVEVE